MNSNVPGDGQQNRFADEACLPRQPDPQFEIFRLLGTFDRDGDRAGTKGRPLYLDVDRRDRQPPRPLGREFVGKDETLLDVPLDAAVDYRDRLARVVRTSPVLYGESLDHCHIGSLNLVRTVNGYLHEKRLADIDVA